MLTDGEDILLKIIQAADYDIERAQYGIIYIDEIDKITENPRIPPSPEMCPVRGRTAGTSENSGRNSCKRTSSGRKKASSSGIY